jgi:transposase-like protein
MEKTIIRYCPYCKKEHEVESVGVLAVQRIDGKYTSCYWCNECKKEFRITEKKFTEE